MRIVIFLILIISFIDAKKVALIVGVSDYENYPKLSTPINDVRSMNNALSDMNFKTLTLENSSKREFEQMIERFRKEASDAEIVLIYFSGHGTAIDGENYLFLRDDKKINDEQDRKKLFKLDDFIDIASEAESGIVIIDACRSNLRIKKNQKGFVPISAKSNTVILTASEFGKTTSDLDKEEGILTKALLKSIKEKISLDEVLQKTQKYVFFETKHYQSPTIVNLDKADSIYLGGIRLSRPPIDEGQKSVIGNVGVIDIEDTSLKNQGNIENNNNIIGASGAIVIVDTSVKSHGYTFIAKIDDIQKLKNMNTYVFLPDNISFQNNHKSKKYKRYEKVLELIQENPKYDINITDLGSKAKEINRFILMNKKSNQEKITVESYNYDLANDIISRLKDKLFRLYGEGPYLVTTTHNIFHIRSSKEFLLIDLSYFNDSAIEEIIRTYKQHLIDNGNVDFSDLEKFRQKVLALITNINSNIKTMRKAVAGEL